MKNMDFSELISKILDVEYTDAIRIFRTMSDKEKESVLWIIAEKYEMAVYPFILSLLINNGSIILYNILDDILSCTLCYIEGKSFWIFANKNAAFFRDDSYSSHNLFRKSFSL